MNAGSVLQKKQVRNAFWSTINSDDLPEHLKGEVTNELSESPDKLKTIEVQSPRH